MKEIALVTYKENPKLLDGEQLLAGELRKRGFQVSEVPWNEDGVNWKGFSSVILRASWDYHTQLSEFTNWLDRLEKEGVNFWNPVDIVKWNLDKHYLRELEVKGIPIIPTVFIDRGCSYDLEKCVSQLDTNTIIIKPTVGASAYGVEKFGRNDLVTIGQYIEQTLNHSDVMVQKFMPQISMQGEYSFIFFDKKYSHSSLKRPAITDYRTQPHFGGSEGPILPSNDLIVQAKRVVDWVESPLLYARVDGIDDDGVLKLMELELIEPYLFFEQGPQTIDRFIKAMINLNTG